MAKLPRSLAAIESFFRRISYSLFDPAKTIHQDANHNKDAGF
jgi:hypothetical protein